MTEEQNSGWFEKMKKYWDYYKYFLFRNRQIKENVEKIVEKAIEEKKAKEIKEIKNKIDSINF